MQIITVHTSKGLEFPVVLVPFAWDNWAGREPATAVFHDEHDHRVRDVGGRGSPDWAAHVRQHKQEETDDELRLTYVALTRAQSHLLLWWAPTSNTPTAPLHRLLLHDGPATVGAAADRGAGRRDGADRVPGAGRASRRRAGCRGGAGRPPVGVVAGRGGGAGAAARGVRPGARHRLAAHLLQRADLGGARAAAGQRAGGRAEGRRGRPRGGAGCRGRADDALRDVASAWDAIPGGAAFGTLVHTVLEQLDDTADDDAVAEVVAAQVARFAPGLDAAALTAGLLAALATPLGSLTDGAR